MASQSNEVQEDFLEVDQQIPGQNYVCLSMISPEKILKNKEVFLSKYFIKYFLKQLKKDNDPLKLDPEKFTEEFVDKLDIDEMYENFRYTQEEQLTQKFSEMNDFQTCVRGLKVRGVYDTIKEAQMRAKLLQKRDPNFHVFVGQVGYWLPWDPNPDGIKNQEYANDQLNTLMKSYVDNKNQKDDLFAQETAAKKKHAMDENRRREYYKNKTDEEEKTAESKISELRDLANEKDGMLSNDNVNLPIKKEVSDGLNDSKFADPWMQNKNEEDEKGNFDAGEANEEISEEKKKENLNNIVKELF